MGSTRLLKGLPQLLLVGESFALRAAPQSLNVAEGNRCSFISDSAPLPLQAMQGDKIDVAHRRFASLNRSDVWSGLQERLEFCSEITLRHPSFQLSMDGESAFRIIH